MSIANHAPISSIQRRLEDKLRLSQWVGEELPATILLDYPSVRELAAEVDKLVTKNAGTESADAPAEASILDMELLIQAWQFWQSRDF